MRLSCQSSFLLFRTQHCTVVGKMSDARQTQPATGRQNGLAAGTQERSGSQDTQDGIGRNKEKSDHDDEVDREASEQHGQQDNRKDEEQQSGPPAAVGYWDPRLKHVRREAWTKWTITTALLMAFIVGVLSIYWGALFHIEKNLSGLVVYVVDMDGSPPYNTDGHDPVVGPIITNIGRGLVASATPNLAYEFPPAADFGYDPVQVRQAVYDFDAWAAIVINPNVTALLYSAIENGNTSYDPMGACQLTYISSRDDTNWYLCIHDPCSDTHLADRTN
jgi:hypothetical protein